MPDVAAAWAAVEACEDPVLRRAAKELRRACSDDTTNVGEVLLWLTRAAEVAAADEEDVVIMEPAAPPSPVRTFDAPRRAGPARSSRCRSCARRAPRRASTRRA